MVVTCLALKDSLLLAKPFGEKKSKLPRQTNWTLFVIKTGKCNYHKFSNQCLEETTNQHGDENW